METTNAIPPDPIRQRRLAAALAAAGLDGLVCALPTNVLLLSGYWPVVGSSIAVATRDERFGVLAPEDERELAAAGRANPLRTFQPSGLDALRTAVAAARAPLGALLQELGLANARLGYEAGPASEPASYAAMHLYGAAMAPLLAAAAPGAMLVPADDLLADLRAALTPTELTRLRAACQIAAESFALGAANLVVGMSEAAAATLFAGPLSIRGAGHVGVARTAGFAYCMAGANAARAGAAYARSSSDVLQTGELALIHVNSTADGFWTDITRTYCLGKPSAEQRQLYEAVFAARAAALAATRPGVPGAAVDRAAREVLTERGYGAAFTHGTGHGVGFAAIDHTARPRLHPRSDDVLAEGMVGNVEPAIYLDGRLGLRHCDMVAVTADGSEVLTPFQSSLEELTLAPAPPAGGD